MDLEINCDKTKCYFFNSGFLHNCRLIDTAANSFIEPGLGPSEIKLDNIEMYLDAGVHFRDANGCKDSEFFDGWYKRIVESVFTDSIDP